MARKSKLTDAQRSEIIARRKAGASAQDLAKEFGVCSRSIYNLCDIPINISNPEKLNMSELRAQLMQCGYSFVELETKTKNELIELLNQEIKEQQPQVGTNTAKVEEKPKVADPPVEQTKEHHIGDPDWPQFILSAFCDEELDGTHPRLDGLRRVAENTIGQIIEEGCDLVASPSNTNNDRACVKAWVIFADKQNGQLRRYESLADASPDNTNDEFAKYPTCLAHTRALARCFRSALHLRCVAAEEVGNTSTTISGISVTNDQIQLAQKSVILLMIDRLGLNLNNLLKEVGINKPNLNDLTREEGMVLSKKLNELQQIKYNSDNNLTTKDKKEKCNARKSNNKV